MVAPEVPRRQSGVLQENGRKDSVAGLVPPATKNGRLSQVICMTHPILSCSGGTQMDTGQHQMLLHMTWVALNAFPIT